MPRAVILGCSHALGAEMDLEPGLEWTADDRSQWHWGPLNSYPAQLAQALGYTVENHAISGGSNDAVFRVFASLFTHDYRTGSYHANLTPEDVVIACWTGPYRTEVWHSRDHLWLPLAAGIEQILTRVVDPVLREGLAIPGTVRDEQLYLSYLQQWVAVAAEEQAGRLNKIKNILALNALAAAHGITVINIDSFAPVVNFEFPSTIFWPVQVDFVTWAEQRQAPKTASGHYFKPTHGAFADHVAAAVQKSTVL
jgi:hypothetical protein